MLGCGQASAATTESLDVLRARGAAMEDASVMAVIASSLVTTLEP